MAFLYSVIGDNTPENREWLEKVGYELVVNSELDKYICVFHDSSYAIGGNFIPDYFYHKAISLIENHQLFQAVTAMRDDNHIHQWHIIDDGVYLDMPKGYWFIATNLSVGKHVGCQIDPMYCHKATLSELKEHFQRV